MKKLEVFRREAYVGAHVTLHLIHGNDISGRIDELEDSYIRLHDEGNTVTVFEELLAGWKIHHASSLTTRADSPNPTPSSEVDTEPSTTADPEALQRLTRIKAEFSVAIDRVKLTLPEPDFHFPEADFPARFGQDVRRQWDQARNKYNYALRVKEISRLNGIVDQILAPLQKSWPSSAPVNALLGRVLLKLNRQSDALVHLSAAAALSRAPEHWLALAAAVPENTALQCYALRRRFSLTQPVPNEDAWFRYLGVAAEHRDLHESVQIIRHWHGQAATEPEIRRFLSESAVYLLSELEANAEVMRSAALMNTAGDLPSAWDRHFTNSAPPSDALVAVERQFVDETAQHAAMTTAVGVPETPMESPTGPRWHREPRITVRELTAKSSVSSRGHLASFGNQRFGFIEAESGGTYYFRIDDVADERLRDALHDGTWRVLDTVEFEILPSPGHKYDRAITILPLQDSKSLLDRAKHLLAIGNQKQTMALVRRVLAEDPTNASARSLEQEVKSNLKKELREGTGLPKGTGPYARAKRAQLVDLDLTEGEKLLQRAIQQGDKPESAVKDLASLLNQQGRIDEAIALLEKHSKQRPLGENPFDNLLATFYEHAGRHDDAIPVLDRLYSVAPVPKKGSLLTRIAFSHLRCSRFDKAEQVLEELLSIAPHDRTALRLADALEDARQAESIAEAAEIIGGLDEGMELSSLARAAIERCEYQGVDPARIQSDAVEEQDVERVVKLAKELGTKRPRDRAAFYLSAAALLQRIDQETQSARIYNYLRSYFTSMADASWTDKKPAEVVRSYYIESLALVDESLDEAWRALIRYLATFSPNLLESIEKKIPQAHRRGKNIPRRKYIDALQETLQMIAPQTEDEWRNGLLAVGSQSSFARRGLGEAFDSSPALRSTFGRLFPDGTGDVRATWETRCREHARAHRRRLSVCRTLTKYQATVASMDSLAQQLRAAIDEVQTEVDRRRLNALVGIVESAHEFCRASDFEERERNYWLVTRQAQEFGGEVVDRPTQYSHEGLLPIANHVKSLIEQEYAQMDRTSGAELGLRLLAEGYLKGPQGELRLQIEVSNKAGCSPASSVRIHLGPENSEYFFAEPREREVASTLRGGHIEIAQMVIYPGANAERDRAFPLIATGIYQNRLGEEKRTASQPWTIRLYRDEDFRHLENPYAPFAEGGPVDDAAMFVGREELLDRLERSLLSESGRKSIVMFGQKRAGKSSLIEHLRRRLVRRSDVLPVCFSLQDIATDLSEPALFHRILHGVSEALDELRTTGRSVPHCTPPSIEALETHASLQFHDKMSSIVRAMGNCSPELKFILLVDEFTDIFKGIRKERIPREFMKAWKAIIEKKYFASVLVGQDIMPTFKKEFPNEFGVTEDFRVTYLDDAAATRLVQEPIGAQRFVGQAVQRLLDLTANSPYYTMMFCSRLVDYMNETRSVVVTVADILSVEKDMLRGERRLTRDKFDNLITAGDGKQDSGIDPNDTYAVCAAIASSRDTWCPRDAMNGAFDGATLDALLSDLETRDVVERKGKEYRLRVGLFRDWLVDQG